MVEINGLPEIQRDYKSTQEDQSVNGTQNLRNVTVSYASHIQIFGDKK